MIWGAQKECGGVQKECGGVKKECGGVQGYRWVEEHRMGV